MAYNHSVYRAAGRGNLRLFEQALAFRPDLLDAPNIDGYTPFHNAAKKGRFNIVRALITRGSQALDTPDNQGRTPLWLTIEWGHWRMMEELISLGASKLPPRRGSYYHAMVNAKNSKGLEVLLRHNFPGIELRDDHGYTVWNQAIKKFNLELVTKLPLQPNLLVGSLADQNYYNFGLPIEIRERQLINIAKILIQRGCRDLEDPILGSNCWKEAIGQRYIHLIHFLIQNGAAGLDVWELPIGDYPIMVAVGTRKLEIVELLLQAGCQTLDYAFNEAFLSEEMMRVLVAIGALPIPGEAVFQWFKPKGGMKFIHSKVTEVRFARRVFKAISSETHLEIVRFLVSEAEELEIRFRIYFQRSLVQRLLFLF